MAAPLPAGLLTGRFQHARPDLIQRADDRLYGASDFAVMDRRRRLHWSTSSSPSTAPWSSIYVMHLWRAQTGLASESIGATISLT